MNDIVWRAVKKAQYPTVKEPAGLARTDSKRPDGATLIPWTRGKPLVWDITIPDTYARSYINDTAARATAAADQAAANKIAKYTKLNMTHQFTPIAIETGGAWNQLAIEFVSELGKKMTEVTKEPRESPFQFQRLSIALQRGNAVAFRNTFTTEQ